MSWSTLLWFVSAALVSSAAKKNFILTGPKVYDTGSTETLAITVFGIEKKGDVHVRLLTSSEQVLNEVTVSVENAQTKIAELSVPSSIPENSFNGKLQAVGSIGDYEINSTVEVTFRQPTTIVFVNTDKPIYKAGQTVRIRVLVTDNNLKLPSPAKDGEIWVTDPSRIRIAQWLNVSFAQGIVHVEIPEDVLKEPPLGIWTIHVKIDDRKYTSTFQVLEYVLPRFEVTVTPPPYVLLTSENATWKVCAKYTYGQPVRGRLHFKLSATRQYWLKETSDIENSTEINGCKEVTLPVKELIGARSYFYGSLELKAEVTEDGTGTKISGTGNIQPSTNTYKIRRQEPFVNYFKPLIPFKVTMLVTTPDSKPLANEKVKVCIKVTRKKWNKLRSITDNLNVCKNYTSNEHGFVIFTIPPQDPYVVSINVEVEATEFDSTLEARGVHRPRDTFRLTPWFSPSGEHLQLLQLPRVNCSAFGPDVKVTQRFYYTFSEPGTRKVYYQIISRGELVKHGDFNITLKADNRNTSDDTYLPNYSEVLCGKESQWDSDFNSSKYTGEFLHTVQLTHEMVPKARVLMYTVTSGLDVVADSTWYDIDPCFANKIEMKFGEQSQFPGSKATIRITAAPQSLCSISVVDKSVYILNKGNILSGNEVSRQLQLLDTSKDTPPYQTTPDYTYCQKKKDADNSEDRGYRTSGYVDAITAFASSGGIVMTDVELETRPCRHSETVNRRCIPIQPVHSKRPAYATTSLASFGATRPISSSFSPDRDKVALNGGSVANDFSPESSPAVTVRTNFPDTWLFQLDKVGDNGELVFKKDVPDSITEWQGTAICVHPEEGLGISKKASIVAVQPFFASLTLPYSVVRNETLPVIVTVFNYLKSCLPLCKALCSKPVKSLHLTKRSASCSLKECTRARLSPFCSPLRKRR